MSAENQNTLPPIEPLHPRWEPATDPLSIDVPGLDRTAPVQDQIEYLEQMITIKLQVRLILHIYALCTKKKETTGPGSDPLWYAEYRCELREGAPDLGDEDPSCGEALLCEHGAGTRGGEGAFLIEIVYDAIC